MPNILKAAVSKARRFNAAGGTAAITAGRRNMIQDVEELERRAHDLGMHVTAHALNRAKNALGWEIAGDVERAGMASRDERPR